MTIDTPEFRELLVAAMSDPCVTRQSRLITHIDAAIAEAVKAQIEKDARVARNYCLVPPDGGSPNVLEVEYCAEISDAIREQST